MSHNPLYIDGKNRILIEIHDFHRQFALTPDFGVSMFEPKDYTGLARLDEGGAALNHLRETLFAAVPDRIAPLDLLDLSRHLSALFQVKLDEINHVIGLKPVEVDFAAAGFEDVCQAFGYAAIRAKDSPVNFDEVYQEWLNGTIRISSTEHSFGAENWKVQVMNYAYGRFGLVIHMPDQTLYVRDAVYMCPAEHFTYRLLRSIAATIQTRLHR